MVASVAAVLAVLLGIQVAHLNNQVGHLQAVVTPGLSSGFSRAGTTVHQTGELVPGGTPSANSPSVTVAVTSSGAAYLIPQDLSKLSSHMTYQLWGQIDGQMISLGLLVPIQE